MTDSITIRKGTKTVTVQHLPSVSMDAFRLIIAGAGGAYTDAILGKRDLDKLVGFAARTTAISSNSPLAPRPTL